MKPMSASLWRAMVICALGYFIDIFDIQLFAVLRIPSLKEIGVPADKLALIGGYIFTVQMLGVVAGGFLWGWLGDRYGRVKAMYGSILLYSLGTFACSFVHDVVTYGAVRFVAGFGLAGEVGAAVVLIAEMMPTLRRGWGITLIGGIGFLGPVAALLISSLLDWRTTYIIAGILGLLLLVLRMRLVEPTLFVKMSISDNLRGSWKLLAQPRQAGTFLLCLLVGINLIYVWNVLNFFVPEIGKAVLGPDKAFNPRQCMLLFYIGTSCGDVLSGIATQLLRSRRKALAGSFLLGAVTSAYYLLIAPVTGLTATGLYVVSFVLGASSGCWALVVTFAGEQFGINIRATVAIVVLNLIRGATIPAIFAFQKIGAMTGSINAAAIIGFTLYTLSFFALSRLRETHHVDLDFVERLEKNASA